MSNPVVMAAFEDELSKLAWFGRETAKEVVQKELADRKSTELAAELGKRIKANKYLVGAGLLGAGVLAGRTVLAKKPSSDQYGPPAPTF